MEVLSVLFGALGNALRMLKRVWLMIPKNIRSKVSLALKLLVTVGAFYLLLSHKVELDNGDKVTTFEAVKQYLPQIDAGTFWKFVLAATLIKLVGIIASMYRWHLMLRGQGIVFPFRHIMGSFLIGRFIGTFLPSTLGLDGYKLYDASRFSRRVVEPASATFIEKLLGFVGIFLTFLVSFPLGFRILQENPTTAEYATLFGIAGAGLSLAVVGGFFLLLFYPQPILWTVRALPIPGKEKIHGFVERVLHSISTYSERGHRLLLVNAAFQSFLVHFCTAAMYFFTALAVGAASAEFWPVTFASTIQIVATVLSPVTIAGEGIRELAQYYLLKHSLGPAQSILSAALGFWAAEALTLAGGVVWWVRGRDYKPEYCLIDGQPAEDLTADETITMPGQEEEAEEEVVPTVETGSLNLVQHLTRCIPAAALGGALFGLIEAFIVYRQLNDPAELGVFTQGVVGYGIFGAGIGLAVAVVLSLATWLSGKNAGDAGLFGISLACGLVPLGTMIGAFRLMRDVFGEKPPGGTLIFLGGCAMVGGVAFLVVWLLATLLAGRGPLAALSRPVGALAGIGALLVVGFGLGAVLGGTPEATPIDAVSSNGVSRPNVLFIGVDTLRADHVSCYGILPGLTPRLDEFCADSVVFQNHFAQASWTKPSFASMMTSLYPSSHSAYGKSSIVPDDVLTWAEAMKEHGYATAALVNNTNVTEVFNFHQGFDDFEYMAPDFYMGFTESGSRLVIYEFVRRLQEVYLSSEMWVQHFYQDAEEVNRRLKAQIERFDGHPWFIWAHYMDPHDPFLTHPYNGHGYARVSMPNPPAEMAEEFKELYAGEVTFMDGHLGELFDWLKAEGMYDNTIIILSSDHGEEFFEHEGYWHGATLYDEQIHTPHIFKHVDQRMAGTVDTLLSRGMDIPPSAMAAAGLPVPEVFQGQNLFVPPEQRADHAFAEEDFEGNVLQAYRTHEWKYIEANEGNPRGLEPAELYHVLSDPGEQNDRFDPQSPVVTEYRTKMGAVYQFATSTAVEGSEAEIDETTLEQLRALGYVQ